MNNRWWLYQRERFPVFVHAPMVLIFCLSAMLFSALQQGEMPDAVRLGGAAVSALIFFFQLRVADEFKDFESDARYRPHRPVPRGIIGLNELARLALLGAALQFVIALSIDVGLVPILFAVWAYVGLMNREFFVQHWLRGHPVAYLFSHMAVMPLIAFYVSAFDWLCDCRPMPAGLGWLLLLSFGCGLVLELGRKIKAPADERTGVETYTALWGRRKSILAWTASAIAAVIAYSEAAQHIPTSGIYGSISLAAVGIALAIAATFPAGDERPARARLIEPGSGLVAMLLYLGLGPLQAILD